MRAAEPAVVAHGQVRTVLHVLPHPGGGGETYVDLLSRMDGYRFERIYLSSSPRPLDALRLAPKGVSRALRGADLLHVHGEVAASLCLPALAVRRSVVTLHGLNLLRRTRGVVERAARLNLGLIVRAANTTICVSEAERHEVVAAAGARATDGVVLIHNGVDLPDPIGDADRPATRAELGLSEASIAGILLGGLDPVKDPLVAVRAAVAAAADAVPIVLLVVGDGPLRVDVERVAGTELGKSVRVLGFRTDTRRLLAAADFYVNSSRHEGLSLSLLEAMAAGLPAVVSDAPGNIEALGAAGYVAIRGDVRSLASSFRELAGDAARRRTLGDQARARAGALFDAEVMVAATRQIYDEAVAR